MKKPIDRYEWRKKRLIDILKYALDMVEKDRFTEECGGVADLLYFDATNLYNELCNGEDE